MLLNCLYHGRLQIFHPAGPEDCLSSVRDFTVGSLGFRAMVRQSLPARAEIRLVDLLGQIESPIAVWVSKCK